MRTIKLTCLAVLLLALTVSARLGDGDAAAAASSPVPSITDVTTFLSGVWDTIGLGREFEDFESCIKNDTNAGTQLQKAMSLMNSSSASNISNGLNKLDKVASLLVAALKDCNMKDKYTKTINQVVNKFTNPGKLTVQTGKNIMIDGTDVYSDVSAAIKAFEAGDYALCGTEIGEAMGKVSYSQDKATSLVQAKLINEIPENTWTAADSEEFNAMNVWQFKKKHLGLRRKKNKNPQEGAPESDDERRRLQSIPTAFDARTQWPGCVQAIRNQASCGGCWAFAASETLGDRFCIASNKTTNKVLSPQFMISCDTSNWGCNGGYLDSAWNFLETKGDVSDTCWPYASGNGVVPACSTFTRCKDGSAMRKYYAKVNSTRAFWTPAMIQAEIIKNGPVMAGMDVYADFMSYRSGIYNPTTTQFLGGHAIKIVGWGRSGYTNYWIVANSWGTYWGEQGYFRIKFGAANMDSSAWAGLPDLTRA